MRAAKERGVPIRIGVNGGSLEKSLVLKYGARPNAGAIVESAMNHIRILEELDFTDIAVSLKSSDVSVTAEAYRKMAELRNYPLHVGVTEAGTPFSGTVSLARASAQFCFPESEIRSAYRLQGIPARRSASAESFCML